MLHGIVKKHHVAVELLSFAFLLFPAGLRPARRVAGRKRFVARSLICIDRLVPELDAAFGKAVAVPIHDLARLFCKSLEKTLIDVAARGLRGNRYEIEFVDLRTPLRLVARTDGGKAFTNARANGKAVDADHLCAALSRGSHGKHAARAAADNENLGLDRLDDVFFCNDRRLPKPVASLGVCGSRFFDNLDRNFAHGLVNTLLRCARDGIRSDSRS